MVLKSALSLDSVSWWSTKEQMCVGPPPGALWDIQGPKFNSQSGSGHVIGAIFTWRYESKKRSVPRWHMRPLTKLLHFI